MRSELKDPALTHFEWIQRVIYSCRDTFQINCAMRLIELFYEKYKDETLTTELKLAHTYQYNSIHQILN